MRSKRTCWINPAASYLSAAIRMPLLCGATIRSHRKLPAHQFAFRFLP